MILVHIKNLSAYQTVQVRFGMLGLYQFLHLNKWHEGNDRNFST